MKIHNIVIQNDVEIVEFNNIGEIKVVLINNGKNTFTINKGDKIAQEI
jgi:dUTPase